MGKFFEVRDGLCDYFRAVATPVFEKEFSKDVEAHEVAACGERVPVSEHLEQCQVAGFQQRNARADAKIFLNPNLPVLFRSGKCFVRM